MASSARTPTGKKPRSYLKDKEVVEIKVKNGRTIRTDEAIASATQNPALQRALERIRTRETLARSRTKTKAKSAVIVPPKTMDKRGTTSTFSTANPPIMTKDEGNVSRMPEVGIPTIKSFVIHCERSENGQVSAIWSQFQAIDIMGKDKVGMLSEGISQKPW